MCELACLPGWLAGWLPAYPATQRALAQLLGWTAAPFVAVLQLDACLGGLQPLMHQHPL
jgi:hypothetical protein